MFLTDLPKWIFDGSSTGQATGPKNSDTNLHPYAIYKDPFRGGNNILVLCDCYNYKNEPVGKYLIQLFLLLCVCVCC